MKKGDADAESEETVPVLQPNGKLEDRMSTLAARFSKKYDVSPSFFVRVPGRVNLIGEHIDYCGYAVCPMAIEQDILVAVAVSRDDRIRLTNMESKYKDFQCNMKDVSACIEDAGGGPDWYKYFLCGVKGALEVMPEEVVPSGMLAAVWGNVPPNSGLSSSSALVSAAVLLTVHANQMIAKKRRKNWEQVQKLIDVQEALGISVDEMVAVVTANLREEPYTLNEICEELGTTIPKMKEISRLGSFDESQPFKLKQRALHVFQEASRVAAFRRVCEDNATMEKEKLAQLGVLMSESHVSLQKLYECSHPSVDALVEDATSCGALGARLTGAGWGGCIVAVTSKDEVSRFVYALKKRLAGVGIKDGFDLDDLVFPVEPYQGAAIYTI
ncbi:N-acetylgalactosamine kinase isoform X2 [Megalopta genalis]|uniref:N-acetylgalactosamine kinase isoform X2 n=1 Tax=Megalopta genalis TaxID=115081 RepID=UPI003FD216DE